MMEAVSSSETPVNVYQTTQCNIPADSHLHTRRRENMKSHKLKNDGHNKQHLLYPVPTQQEIVHIFTYYQISVSFALLPTSHLSSQPTNVFTLKKCCVNI
jgi:hypothetical protein